VYVTGKFDFRSLMINSCSFKLKFVMLDAILQSLLLIVWKNPL